MATKSYNFNLNEARERVASKVRERRQARGWTQAELGSLDGRWGFSADLGLAANGLGPLRLDRPALSLGSDGLPRLLPMVRLGMTLAF